MSVKLSRWSRWSLCGYCLSSTPKEELNFAGLCRTCARFEIPLRTQLWVWFCDLFRRED